MSAIVGIMQRQGSTENLSHDLQRALASMAAYGPEGSRYWVGDRTALGHQQMVITHEDNLERLPSYDGTSRLAITADVRLDNREDLSAAFGLSSSELTHITDSALILMAYQKWGDACPLSSSGGLCICNLECC